VLGLLHAPQLIDSGPASAAAAMESMSRIANLQSINQQSATGAILLAQGDETERR